MYIKVSTHTHTHTSSEQHNITLIVVVSFILLEKFIIWHINVTWYTKTTFTQTMISVCCKPKPLFIITSTHTHIATHAL